MPDSTTICVFCASSDHIPEVYHDTAAQLAEEFIRHGASLVYGGGNNGLMGTLSDSLHRLGGHVTGVIPRELKDRGYAFQDADELIETENLRQRKAIMEQRADGFICMAGGFGTLEEILEVITLRQLGMLNKPIAIVNTNRFFNGLLDQFEHMCHEQFFGPDYRNLFFMTESPAEAVAHIIDT